MSFDPNKLSLPVLKRLVRDQRKALAEITGQAIPQHQAQEVVARMLGYATWHDAFTRAKAAGLASGASPSDPLVLDDFWVRHNRPDDAVARIAEAMTQGNASRITAGLDQFEVGMKGIHEQKIAAAVKQDEQLLRAVPLARKTFVTQAQQTAWYEARKTWEQAFEQWGKAACADRTGVAMRLLLPLDPFSANRRAGDWIKKHPENLEWDAGVRGMSAEQLKTQGIDRLFEQAVGALNQEALAHLSAAYPRSLVSNAEILFNLVTAQHLNPWTDRPVTLEERWPMVAYLMNHVDVPAAMRPTRALLLQLMNVSGHFDPALTARLAQAGANVPGVLAHLSKIPARQWEDRETREEVLARVQSLASTWGKPAPSSTVRPRVRPR